MKKIIYLLLLAATTLCNAQATQQKDVFNVARSGTVEEMRELMKIDKDTINTLNHMGFSPLILACYRGNAPVAEFLAKNVSNINYNSSNGTALAAAAVKGNTALVKVLLENKANPNLADGQGMTPLLYAAQFDNKEIVALLLHYKADKNMADNEGKKPMDYAVFNKSREMIALLEN